MERGNRKLPASKIHIIRMFTNLEHISLDGFAN